MLCYVKCLCDSGLYQMDDGIFVSRKTSQWKLVQSMACPTLAFYQSMWMHRLTAETESVLFTHFLHRPGELESIRNSFLENFRYCMTKKQLKIALKEITVLLMLRSWQTKQRQCHCGSVSLSLLLLVQSLLQSTLVWCSHWSWVCVIFISEDVHSHCSEGTQDTQAILASIYLCVS